MITFSSIGAHPLRSFRARPAQLCRADTGPGGGARPAPPRPRPARLLAHRLWPRPSRSGSRWPRRSSARSLRSARRGARRPRRRADARRLDPGAARARLALRRGGRARRVVRRGHGRPARGARSPSVCVASSARQAGSSITSSAARSISTLRALVLDEADEMLDMGFHEELEKLLGAAPPDRRTVLFSATLPRPIVELAKRCARPARVAATPPGEAHADIAYRAHLVAPREREHGIVNVLRDAEGRRARSFSARRARRCSTPPRASASAASGWSRSRASSGGADARAEGAPGRPCAGPGRDRCRRARARPSRHRPSSSTRICPATPRRCSTGAAAPAARGGRGSPSCSPRRRSATSSGACSVTRA